jgi:TPR repeat protein
LGISHHENDRLEESAYWFEKAANENGGCGVGMLMWGLSLRHAWGVEKDERAAFWWLRRAAECAVEDLEKANNASNGAGDSADRDRRAVQSELVLAIYEVGQCFFHGWGVETDKKMAVVSIFIFILFLQNQ